MPTDDAGQGPGADLELSQPDIPAPEEDPLGLAGFATPGPTIKSIIGDEDTRRAVTDPTAAPWSGVGRLSVTGSAGESEGTAFLISQRWAMTAAHVIVDAGNRPQPRLHLGSAGTFAAAYLPHPDYRRTRSPEHDVALLRLDHTAPGFQFVTEPIGDAELQTLMTTKAEVRVAGYPKLPVPKLVWGAGALVDQRAQVICHHVDTGKGQSGAPLFLVRPGTTRLLGVHAHGDVRARAAPGVPNLAVRMTPWVCGWVEACQAKHVD